AKLVSKATERSGPGAESGYSGSQDNSGGSGCLSGMARACCLSASRVSLSILPGYVGSQLVFDSGNTGEVGGWNKKGIAAIATLTLDGILSG
ncbi:MAG: hypothetical protein ACW99G_21650, partial [Candidatus Thorarchaeota archaeon]